MEYKSASVSVDETGVVITPTFDIGSVSFFSTGNYTVELYDKNGYGDLIRGVANVGMCEVYDCTQLRIKSLSGTITVHYFVRTN